MSNNHRIASAASVQSFANIAVPDALRTSLSTGWEYADALFTGQGIRPSTCGMITGLPGSGKTTFSLQLADSLLGAGHTVFYNSCEESGEQIKMTLERLGLRNMLTKGFHASICEVGEILEAANKLRANVKQGKGFFMFVDSLQTIEKTRSGAGRPSSQQNQATEATWDIAAWCKDNMTVSLIIGQVTKDGTFAGKQEVKHALDYHLHLSMDTDKRSDTYKQRIAEVQKNRFGQSGLFFPYELTNMGIQFAQ
jgi:predicted ATP-dependent serine protease